VSQITQFDLAPGIKPYEDSRDSSKNTPASAGASYSAGEPALAHYTTNTEPGDELDQELCDEILLCVDLGVDDDGSSLLTIFNQTRSSSTRRRTA
jgi:hypothetical protein